MKKLLKERSNKMQNDTDTIYWDSENNVHMQYSPIWERFIPKKISVWDIDKPEYQPENLPNYQESLRRNYKSSLSETEQNSVKPPFKHQYTPLHNRRFYDNINPITPHKHGVMINDYSEPIDTIKLAKESPHLDRITDFSKSKSVSDKTWGNLIDGVNYLDQNKYGKKILENIPNKSLHFKFSKSLNVPGQINKNEKSITFSNESPQLSQQSEELIHAAQFNKYYGGKENGYQNIPGINFELEAKVTEDIIDEINKNEVESIIVVPKDKNLSSSTNVYKDSNSNLLFPSAGSKIFMGADFNNEYVSKLYDKYVGMIERVAQNKHFTSEDLEIYKEVGKFISLEKSKHDSREFNEDISPSFIMDTFNK